MAGMGILERMAAGPLVGDGGYFLELEKRGYVQAGPFTSEVSLLYPRRLWRCTVSSFTRALMSCRP
jgi:hypothetical protein